MFRVNVTIFNFFRYSIDLFYYFFNTKNKYSDLLYSLKTESFKNIDRDALDDTDKPLYDLVAKMVAKQARRDKAVGNKNISQVNREILYGDEGYQGYEGYKQDAKDGTLSIKNLKNFVKGLQAKLVAFNKAVSSFKTGGVDSQLQTEQYGAALSVVNSKLYVLGHF